MKINEVYFNELVCAQEYGNQSKNANNSKIVRDQFFVMSVHCEEMAGHLAHCNVLFGDRDIENINFGELLKTASDIQSTYFAYNNPWLNGLEYLKDIALQGALPEIKKEPPPFNYTWFAIP